MTDEIQAEGAGFKIADQAVTCPDIYFNGMDIGVSLSDMNITVMTDGRPLCKLHMSFTTAKTLAVSLGGAVTHFENLTNHSVMTMEEVGRGLEKDKNE